VFKESSVTQPKRVRANAPSQREAERPVKGRAARGRLQPATAPASAPWAVSAPTPYRTPNGAQLVGDSRVLLASLADESVDLVMTSPPFALLREKPYGNETQLAYVQWLAEFGEAAKRVLKPTGSFVLDLGGAYQRGVPVRALYPYRTLLSFCDDLGYFLAEEFFWHNPSKLPSPIEWVNKRKIRAKDAVNNVWWFSKSTEPKADVRRVLKPYGPRMLALLGDPDGYYRAKERPSGHGISKAFARNNGGSLPSNLLSIPNTESNSHYLRACKAVGQKAHPARFPAGLPQFFIRMLTEPGDLVLDIFAGSNTTGYAAEAEGRRWLAMELDADYARLAALRFLHKATPTQLTDAYERVCGGEELLISDGLVVDELEAEAAQG
jgi:DNA modification methylase